MTLDWRIAHWKAFVFIGYWDSGVLWHWEAFDLAWDLGDFLNRHGEAFAFICRKRQVWHRQAFLFM